MKKKEKKIIYFSDELNNDFAGTSIKTCRVDESFQYIHEGLLWRILSFVLYYIVAFPLVWIYENLILKNTVIAPALYMEITRDFMMPLRLILFPFHIETA